MRRVVMGLVWFVVLYQGALMIGGTIAGGVAANEAAATSSAFAAGQRASKVFAQRYGSLVFVGTLAVAGLGTAAGLLPGTRGRARVVRP